MQTSLFRLIRRRVAPFMPLLQIRSSYSGTEPDSRESIIKSYFPQNDLPENKIGIIGLGTVGEALCVTLLLKNVTNHIAIVDPNLNEELLSDLQFGSVLLRDAKIEGSRDYNVLSHSRICIVTAGVRPKPGGTRIDVASDNVKLLKSVVGKIMEHSPNSILILIANPVDVLTWAAVKISGLPKHKVIGSGTNLESARLRYLMSEFYGVGCSNCEGWYLGEHGNSCAPIYSSYSVGGAYISNFNSTMGSSNDNDKWKEVHEKVRTRGSSVNTLKGYTNWAVALSATDIINSIVKDTRKVHAVTVCAHGYYGLKSEVYLSLPAILCKNGISKIIEMDISTSERQMLEESAKYLHSVQNQMSL